MATRWRSYHHVGIPTTVSRPGETYLDWFKVHCTDHESNTCGIQWMRFEPECPLPELVQTVPHVAFEVEDLHSALAGHDVLIEPNSPSDGVLVAFIVEDGAPIEFLQFVGGRESLASAEERLLSTFEKFKEALLGSDVQALRAMIADDYLGFDPQGRPQDRAMILEAYRPGGVRLDSYDVEDCETRITGNVGIITGTGRIHGTYGAQQFEHRVRFLDLYVHKSGRWQLYVSQVTPLG